jgi:hypothetical protein
MGFEPSLTSGEPTLNDFRFSKGHLALVGTEFWVARFSVALKAIHKPLPD